MGRIPSLTLLLIALLAVAIVGGVFVHNAVAQDIEKSRFVRFVENQLSTPDRQIRLGAIDGLLSSDVRLSEISVADRDGVWLTITDVELVWSRLALLRGRLSVDSLTAASIDVVRKPLPPENAPPEPEESGEQVFELPSLPVSVRIRELDVSRITVAQDVIGTAFAVDLRGRIILDSGELETELTINRLDQEGRLRLAADFDNDARTLAIDLTASEPENGVIANALNIVDLPSVNLNIQGSGPLETYQAAIDLSAGGTERLVGSVSLDGTLGGTAFKANLVGDLEPLVAPLYRPLVAGGSSIVVDGLYGPTGALSLDNVSIDSGAATLALAAEFTPQFVPTQLTLNGSVGGANAPAITLPGTDRGTVQSATIRARLGGGFGERYEFSLAVVDLQTPFFSTPRFALEANGVAQNLARQSGRRVTFNITGDVADPRSNQAGVGAALGTAPSLSATGSWADGAPVTVQGAAIETAAAAASFSGEISDAVAGEFALRLSDLRALAALSGRDLRGALAARANGRVGFDGTFDVTLDATANDIFVGIDAVDGILAGATTLSGEISKSTDGVGFKGFRVANDALQFQADGTLSETAADLSADLSLADLSALSKRLAGGVEVAFKATGNPSRPTLVLSATSATLTLDDTQTVEDLSVQLDGVFDRTSGVTADLDGQLTAQATVDGQPARLDFALETDADGRSLRDLSFALLGATASGDLTIANAGRLDGAVQVDVPNLAPLAKLAAQEAAGSLSANLSFTAPDDGQDVAVKASARGVSVAGAALRNAQIDMRVSDVFGVPLADGGVVVEGLAVAGFDVDTLRLTAQRQGNSTQLALDTQIADANLDAAGSVTRTAGGFSASLARLSLVKGPERVALQSPTTVSLTDGVIDIAATTLTVSGGEIVLEGRAGDDLDIRVSIDQLPLDIADIVRPDLGLSGVVDASVSVSGTKDAPQGDATVAMRNVSAALLRQRGIEPVAIDAKGTFADGTANIERLTATLAGGSVRAFGQAGETLDLVVSVSAFPLAVANAFAPDVDVSGTLNANAKVTGSASDPAATFSLATTTLSAAPLRDAGFGPVSVVLEGSFARGTVTLSDARATLGEGSLTARGTVGDELNLAVDVASLPLAVVNGVQPGLGVSGTLSGSVAAQGSLGNPNVRFDLAGRQISAAPLEGAGAGPINTDISGTFANNIVQLTRATANGLGLQVSARGTIPLSSGGLNLSLEGAGPLLAANRIVAERGASVEGEVSFALSVSGSLSAPSIDGRADVRNVLFRDSQTALVLREGRASARFTGDRVVIDDASFNLGGGRISATGEIGLGPGLPAQIGVAFDRARYTDGELVAVTMSGSLTVSGPIAEPDVVGRITLDRAEISIPTSLNGTGPLIEVQHVDPSIQVLETLRRARAGPYAERETTGSAASGGPRLDITIDAPARIFVRGRGIDAELGGSVRITGPVSDIVPVGGFELIRGRIVILSQRIEITTGEVTLVGDLNPAIYFVAQTTTTEATIRVIVSGEAQAPQITFESDPELPQDEVLALLLFGRNVEDLSAFQLAQLAASVAELAGGGGPGILEQIRVFSGLDNLEIITDEDGNTAAQAGRYINDRIYLGVKAGAVSSGISVNIDITRGLKLRAETLTDQDTVGIFYEREY